MKYKVVPFSASVSSTQNAATVASQVDSIIASHAASGWEFVSFHQIQAFQGGSAGCFGLGATPPTTIPSEFIIFRQ